MEPRKLRTIREADACVELYIKMNDEDFIPADKSKSIESFSTLVKSGAFLRILDDEDGEIVAWLLAQKVDHPHIKGKILQQYFYASNLTGIKAVKAVIILHNALIEEAERLQIKYIFSLGSYLDEKNTFVKILEKNGWKRRNYAAVYTTKLPEIL
jgi:succinate dehydrogenase flavin-adding protein (antitoxin of CptAB toxin-antitoxin module)